MTSTKCAAVSTVCATAFVVGLAFVGCKKDDAVDRVKSDVESSSDAEPVQLSVKAEKTVTSTWFKCEWNQLASS